MFVARLVANEPAQLYEEPNEETNICIYFGDSVAFSLGHTPSSKHRRGRNIHLFSGCLFFDVLEWNGFSRIYQNIQPESVYTYTVGNQASAPSTYSYTVQASNENAGSYNYATTNQADTGFYTYSTAAQPETSGGAVYTAEPAPQQMTIINGYATQPQEQVYFC